MYCVVELKFNDNFFIVIDEGCCSYCSRIYLISVGLNLVCLVFCDCSAGVANLKFEYEKFKGTTVNVPEICDGSHRIEVGKRKGLVQNILMIDTPKHGFPYYAAPKPYSCIHEEPERDENKIDKTHILTSPGHKMLYRLFPSGGINSGTVRPTKEKFD